MLNIAVIITDTVNFHWLTPWSIIELRFLFIFRVSLLTAVGTVVLKRWKLASFGRDKDVFRNGLSPQFWPLQVRGRTKFRPTELTVLRQINQSFWNLKKIPVRHVKGNCMFSFCICKALDKRPKSIICYVWAALWPTSFRLKIKFGLA